MPEGWQWDKTLFAGSAQYYVRGRLPYPDGLADALATALGLDGRGRLIDVGCGPGLIALDLAHLFEEVVGLDPDPGMLDEARRLADERGCTHAQWVCARAEDLPLDLGHFRVATLAQSFHWMDRERVARTVREMLEPAGAFVQVSAATDAPLREDVRALVERYLGSERRAGQGVLRHGTPGDEASVLRAAGFDEPRVVAVPGGTVVERSTDDMVASVFAHSGRAPHLFGDRLAEFERELRALLGDGPFQARPVDAELRIWRRA